MSRIWPYLGIQSMHALMPHPSFPYFPYFPCFPIVSQTELGDSLTKIRRFEFKMEIVVAIAVAVAIDFDFDFDFDSNLPEMVFWLGSSSLVYMLLLASLLVVTPFEMPFGLPYCCSLSLPFHSLLSLSPLLRFPYYFICPSLHRYCQVFLIQWFVALSGFQVKAAIFQSYGPSYQATKLSSHRVIKLSKLSHD